MRWSGMTEWRPDKLGKRLPNLQVRARLQAAPLAVLLNLEPEHSISELADPTSAIDSIRLESVLCKHYAERNERPKSVENIRIL